MIPARKSEIRYSGTEIQLFPPVDVLEADDVRLTEAAATAPRSCAAAPCRGSRCARAHRTRLDSFSESRRFPRPGWSARGAPHHDPVLGTMVVHSPHCRRARLHRQALHLEALASVDMIERPQGRNTSRCRLGSPRPSSFRRFTSSFTSCTRSARRHHTASLVSTTTWSFSPTAATSRLEKSRQLDRYPGCRHGARCGAHRPAGRP